MRRHYQGGHHHRRTFHKDHSRRVRSEVLVLVLSRLTGGDLDSQASVGDRCQSLVWSWAALLIVAG